MPFSAENVALTFPKVTLLANDISLNSLLPAVTLTARDADGYAEISIPAITLDSYADVSSVGGLNKNFPAVALSAEAQIGVVGTLTRSLPAVTLEVEMTRGGTATLTLPAITLSAQGELIGTWTLAQDVPALQLNAIGDGVQQVVTTTDYAVWVINSNIKAHSTYDNWQAGSYDTFNGKEYITLPDGIYELTGDDDAGTTLSGDVRWVPTDLGDDKQKRVDSLSINMRNLSQDDIRISVKVDEQEERYYNKEIAPRPEGMRRHRQLLPKGLQGQVWQFGVQNQDSGQFVLDEIEVLVEELKRRFR